MASNNLSNAAGKVFGVRTKGSRPLVPSQKVFHVALLLVLRYSSNSCANMAVSRIFVLPALLRMSDHTIPPRNRTV